MPFMNLAKDHRKIPVVSAIFIKNMGFAILLLIIAFHKNLCNSCL